MCVYVDKHLIIPCIHALCQDSLCLSARILLCSISKYEYLQDNLTLRLSILQDLLPSASVCLLFECVCVCVCVAARKGLLNYFKLFLPCILIDFLCIHMRALARNKMKMKKKIKIKHNNDGAPFVCICQRAINCDLASAFLGFSISI